MYHGKMKRKTLAERAVAAAIKAEWRRDAGGEENSAVA